MAGGVGKRAMNRLSVSDERSQTNVRREHCIGDAFAGLFEKSLANDRLGAHCTNMATKIHVQIIGYPDRL